MVSKSKGEGTKIVEEENGRSEEGKSRRQITITRASTETNNSSTESARDEHPTIILDFDGTDAVIYIINYQQLRDFFVVMQKCLRYWKHPR